MAYGVNFLFSTRICEAGTISPRECGVGIFRIHFFFYHPRVGDLLLRDEVPIDIRRKNPAPMESLYSKA